MAQEKQITCITRRDRTNPHERISHVGGSGWKYTLDQAIGYVENGTYRFWTQGGGKSVWVVVATAASGHKYLKTEADGVQPDNLLALPACP